VASGFALAAVTLAAAWAGGLALALLLLIGVIAALFEFFRMSQRAGHRVLMLPGLAGGAAIVVLGAFHRTSEAGPVLMAIALWMILASLRSPIEGRFGGLALSVFGVLYVAGFGVHLLWLRELERGLGLLLVVLLGTWAADTFAFFVGIRWGRRKLAPHVSPGKSVEGFLGGLAGTMLVAGVAARFVSGFTLPEALLAGLVIGLVSPIGDLLESLMKRNLCAKDASHIIPGHGGVLDRIDSLLLVAPVAFYLFRYLLR
jgi:phosphatidate cytidylyltransferase